MIIRILGDNQYEVPEAELDRLNGLDDRLQTAVDDGNQAAFNDALSALLAEVRRVGSVVPDEILTASDLVLPAEGSDLAQVSAMLGDEGLIPD